MKCQILLSRKNKKNISNVVQCKVWWVYILNKVLTVQLNISLPYIVHEGGEPAHSPADVQSSVWFPIK